MVIYDYTAMQTIEYTARVPWRGSTCACLNAYLSAWMRRFLQLSGTWLFFFWSGPRSWSSQRLPRGVRCTVLGAWRRVCSRHWWGTLRSPMAFAGFASGATRELVSQNVKKTNVSSWPPLSCAGFVSFFMFFVRVVTALCTVFVPALSIDLVLDLDLDCCP